MKVSKRQRDSCLFERWDRGTARTSPWGDIAVAPWSWGARAWWGANVSLNKTSAQERRLVHVSGRTRARTTHIPLTPESRCHPLWRTQQGYPYGSTYNSMALWSIATLTLRGFCLRARRGLTAMRHPSSAPASETNALQPAAKYRTWNTWWNMQLRAYVLVRSRVGGPPVTYFLTD